MREKQASDFFKFPRTPHLFAHTGADLRVDKVMSSSECNSFLSQRIIIEEKVDGANLGISLNPDGVLRLQNRGNYLTVGEHPQFSPAWDWAYSRLPQFNEHLSDHLIVFGEWCYYKHSIFYSKLPDWFLGFDVYDKTNKQFISIAQRNKLFEKLNIVSVPKLDEGYYEKRDIVRLLETSSSMLGGSSLEGLYLREETAKNLVRRAKVVNNNFIQHIDEHWTKQKPILNIKTGIRQ